MIPYIPHNISNHATTINIEFDLPPRKSTAQADRAYMETLIAGFQEALAAFNYDLQGFPDEARDREASYTLAETVKAAYADARAQYDATMKEVQ